MFAKQMFTGFRNNNTIQYNAMQYNNTLLILKKRKFSCLPLTNNNNYIKT